MWRGILGGVLGLAFWVSFGLLVQKFYSSIKDSALKQQPREEGPALDFYVVPRMRILVGVVLALLIAFTDPRRSSGSLPRAQSPEPRAQSLKPGVGRHRPTEKSNSINAGNRPAGFMPIGLFFIFGSTMAAYAAITLAFPGTPLDAVWVLNKRGHEGLVWLGRTAAVPFVLLSIALGCAAVGWFQRRRWGWVLGVTIISINMLGDMGQVAFGERWKGVVGVVIAGALLGYMTRAGVKNYFRSAKSWL